MSSQIKGDDNKTMKENMVPQSYKGMTLEEARLFIRNIMDMFMSLASMNDLKTMYEAGKQLSRLYFDCANHQKELSDILLELEFPEYAIKTMKKLNNMGVFKNDDIWFSSFYFYNICWNYSDASFEFATALGICGLPNLLNLNIGHKPYLDNLSSRNVYYLIKASLSIIHNICRYPGSCIYFRSEAVKMALINLIKREEDFIRVVASLCLASIVGENDVSLMRAIAEDGDEKGDILLSIINYVRKARSSDRGRFMGFRSHELLQGIRSATTVECEKQHFMELDGILLVKEILSSGPSALDEDVAECLEILCNIAVEENDVDNLLLSRLREAGLSEDLVRPWAVHDNPRVRTAAQNFIWCLESPGTTETQTVVLDKDVARLVPIYVSYANVNKLAVQKILDKLSGIGLVTFVNTDDRFNTVAVKAALRQGALVLACVSEAYKSEPRHRLEARYAARLKRPLLPVLIQQKYRQDGWLQRLLDQGSMPVQDLSSKRDFDVSWESFTGIFADTIAKVRSESLRRQTEIKPKRESERQVDSRQNCLEDTHMSRSQHEPMPTEVDSGFRRLNGGIDENNVLEEVHRPVSNVKGSGGISATWLERNGLGHLCSRLTWLDQSLLVYYQDIKARAPEYFYQTLETRLKLDLVDILKFSNAINDLS